MEKFYLFGYFLAILAIGFYSYKKVNNSKDFFVAGKNSGVLEVTGSLLATILGSSAIIGSINFAYANGWSGSWTMICASIGLLLLYPFVKYLKDFTGYNLPEMLGNFYGVEVKKISSIIISIAWIGIVASQILGAAQIFTILSPYSYSSGVIICGSVFLIYTLLGGQLSVIKTDFIQLIFIIAGLVVTFIYVNMEPVTVEVPKMISEKFSYLDLVILLLTYSSTFVVGPDIYSRLFCAKDEKTMKKSIIISILVLLPLAYIFSRIGIYGVQHFSTIPTGQSVLFVIASEKLPLIVSSLLYFAILSAVISSADTTLFTASSLLSQVFLDRIDNEKGIKFTRIFVVVIGVLSILVALKMKYILATFFLALGVYSGAIIIPTLVGMLGFRTKKEVIMTAICVGGGVALFGKIKGGDLGNYLVILAFVLNGAILYVGNLLKKS